ncbi:hypothetical protein AWJ20_108 [Sugiyamaella lignohabitans]|uniref:Uncharacterized protein n=1 Tax=Sugiyamaella lignohabitans TaxID=796027 RepID=A0A167CMA9_9ASCO|nr:uncharacterized protein AWJ20_108 [Sugiyamaella lignohabitans]ANB11883.1 hypothetical protein AWJ20_108 [Sugiyamaella lignohabitans]
MFSSFRTGFSLPLRGTIRVPQPRSFCSLKQDLASRQKNLLPKTFKRNNTQLPKNVNDKNNLTSNDWKSRVPQFPFGKEVAPTLIPKANTPRVTKDFTFRQLVMSLKNAREPELLYTAESHRLYFLTSVALTFVVSYNLFDLVDRSVKSLIEEYKENPEDLSQRDNQIKAVKRGSLIALMASIYATAAFVFATFPTRLVRRIEYLPGNKEYLRLVTHPWFPGKPSPVLTIPLENLSIGKRSKVWTGSGFYGTAHRSSFFFFIFEKDKWFPWIVDRSGWFWGDGRVYDVILGKESIELAEKGLSYDDILRIQQNEASKRKTELRRELGPAWRAKAMGQLMKEDAVKLQGAAKRALNSSVSNHKQLPGEDQEKK